MAKRNVEKPGVRAKASDAAEAPARGPMRAMWKATLDFGGIELPVKLYAAVEDRDVRFRLIDAKNRVPVKQRVRQGNSREEKERLRIQGSRGNLQTVQSAIQSTASSIW